ncbi:MAG: EAL domain-containing protein [Betaproteobacteria bacterium]|nr:EAL domain-containing protein [Betaproteobacteria bacterium]
MRHLAKKLFDIVARAGLGKVQGRKYPLGYKGRRLKNALEECEDRFLSLAQLSSDWIWEQDRNFRFVFHEGSIDRTGIEHDNVIGKTRWELPIRNFEADPGLWAAHRAQLEAHQAFNDLEYQIEDAEGATRWYSASGFPLFDGQGNFKGYRGIGKDISARKRAEEALKESEKRLKLALEASRLTLWDYNIDSGIVYLSETWSELLDGAKKVTITTFDALIALAPEEDRPGVIRAFTTTRQESAPAYSIEHRIVTPAGKAIWIINEGQVIERDAAGHARRMIGTIRDITEKKQSEELIWKQANFDVLTGLPNRRLFHDRLDQEIKKMQRAGQLLALLFIDLDRFKDINDTLGHSTGDLLLIEAARRIGECVRASDTVARLGGDEFTVIMPTLADVKRVGELAQTMLKALAAPFLLGSETAYVSASIGIAIFPDDAEGAESLIKHADQAMYAAKEQGRNCFSYFSASMQVVAQERMQLGKDLRVALAGNQLMVYYQPIVYLKTGKIVKAEALLRWRHPTRGMVGPAEFIPLAEELNLIGEIGDWVFKESARKVKEWCSLERDCVQVSVNKSPRQFHAGKTQESWVDYMQEIDLPASCINIEITEGLLLDDHPEIAGKLIKFRDGGVQISLDDFGTGYSAMSYLKKFHIDYLKIDRSFVRDMSSDPGDLAIVEAIIVMAHKLGLKVVAEGVETIGQLDLLSAAGCDYGQGYFFAEPMPPEAFDTLLDNWNPGNKSGC